MPGFSRRSFVKTAGAGLALAGAGLAPSAASWAAPAVPRRGGVLTATIGFPEPHAMFVPAGGGGSPAFTAARVLEQLVSIQSDLSVKPKLATAWRASPDFRSYAITLQPGVKWHDGRDFTAEDVAFTIGVYWKQIAAGGALTALKSAQATGPLQVRVDFDQPVPEFSFLYVLGTQAVIPAHIYATGNINTNPANNAPVGTGPYIFQRWVRGSRAEFARNEHYWQTGKPYPDRLVVRWWREPAARAAALEAGELDIGVQNPVPFADIKRLRDSGKISVTEKGYEISDWESGLIFNVKNPITRHRAVRQAILYALDRQYIADVIYQGFATVARSPIGSNNKLYYNPDVPQYPYDKARAQKLLDEAGFARKGDAPRFTLRLVAAGWVDENAKVGAYVKQALEDIGIAVELQVPDRATSLKLIYTDYAFDLALSNNGSTAEPVPQTTQLYTSEGIARGMAFRNASQFADPAIDALVARITFEVDHARRRALVDEFARGVLTEVPFFRLVEIKKLTVARNAVQGHSDSGNFQGESWAGLWLAA
jgi:peptide/nickel transport system substrate-binding protein